MSVFNLHEGDSPIILGQPHGGTDIPEDLVSRLNDTGKAREDTDWHITRLYDGLLQGATIVASSIHRYVIDCNRDPAGVSLYPGQNTTSLCPLTSFDGTPIWQEGQEPSEDEILARREAFHAPYHAALKEQIERVIDRHGVAILYDCHSIRSDIPFLFEGQLPVFNIGTNLGETCDAAIERITTDICQKKRLGNCHQWPLQGWLDHPALWPTGKGLPCHPDGTGPAGLYAGSSPLDLSRRPRGDHPPASQTYSE